MTKSLTMFLGVATVAVCSKASTHTRTASAGDALSIDACALLTQAEIQQAFGVAMKPGVKQTTPTSSQCEWDRQTESDAVGISVSVATYDDALFRTQASAKQAVPVLGLGQAAYKGYPQRRRHIPQAERARDRRWCRGIQTGLVQGGRHRHCVREVGSLSPLVS